MFQFRFTVAPFLIFALLLGCSANGKSQVDRAPAAKRDGPPADLAAKEKELAELEKQIATKEKELAELKAKAGALRAAVAKHSSEGDEKPFTSLSQVVAIVREMPKELYPLPGDDGGPERIAANSYLKKRFDGKRMELKVEVIDTDLKVKDDFLEGFVHVNGLPNLSTLRLGTNDWNVHHTFEVGGSGANGVISKWDFFAQRISADAGKRLRSLKGKTATLTGTVSARFGDGEFGNAGPQLSIAIKGPHTISGVSLRGD